MGYGFDLIFMNVQLPTPDGVEAIRRLRVHGFAAPIIAICDEDVPGIEKQCFDAGCSDFIGPTADFDPIHKSVQSCFG